MFASTKGAYDWYLRMFAVPQWCRKDKNGVFLQLPKYVKPGLLIDPGARAKKKKKVRKNVLDVFYALWLNRIENRILLSIRYTFNSIRFGQNFSIQSANSIRFRFDPTALVRISNSSTLSEVRISNFECVYSVMHSKKLVRKLKVEIWRSM